MKKLLVSTACIFLITFQAPVYATDFAKCDEIEQRAEAHEQAGMYQGEVAEWLAKEVFLSGKPIEQCYAREASGKEYVIRGWIVKENVIYRAMYKGRLGTYKP